MVKIQSGNCYEKQPTEARENQNDVSENPQRVSEVEVWLIRNEGNGEEETSNDPRSNLPTNLEASSCISCPEEDVPRAEPLSPSDQSRYHLPTKQEKQIFFQILKDLLENPLESGQKGVRQCGGNILELTYMNERCELRILNSDRVCQWEQKLKTDGIYLKWRGNHVERLSPAKIQMVQNELKSLGIQSDRLRSCFSLARTEFMEEPSYVKKNMKLHIICDEAIITFSEGKGENVATVLYDDNLSSPKYFLEAKDWWVKIGRFFVHCLRQIKRWADNLDLIGSKIDLLISWIAQWVQNLPCFTKPKSQ
ncbi:hypothetical protein JRQ81_003485 [Phrynocephalus forsythii]|uniref:Uncharacterized protein n=1 Tax=Phrynocephalus forsythii TaxID=171643 RepID=A0A9Q1AXQ8_9SAUR|nr:hypothetical protein JRQ81_003485 [Phrynocephalus forsythii]